MSKMNDVERSFRIIVKKLGGLHILVNNAGITNNISMDNLTLEEWKKVIDVNLTGSFICSKIAAGFILKSGGGVIIMVSSGSSLTGSGGGAHYAASKGGINSLVRALSRELAPKGIKVNAVAPRYINTEILSSLYAREEYLKIEKKIPLRRLGTVNDVANVVAFLASDLSSYISGEIILVDGGVTFGG
ncbi:MAG: SDR family oxidoreductase [Actinobacteria bacterium]|nr:SDR family oxidoreductase [Actinomycetota bacterium]